MLFMLVEHILFTLVVAILVGIYLNKGREELLRVIVVGLKHLPGAQNLLGKVLHNEAANFIKTVDVGGSDENRPPQVAIPKKGVPRDELRKEMDVLRAGDKDNEEGKIFAYTYTMHDDHLTLQRDCFVKFADEIGHSVDHDALVREFHHAFLHENALNPMLFPSLRKMETEIVSMTAAMLNGSDEAQGFLTSGGTESILMAVKVYRDRARKLFPHIKTPEIVAPITAHPALDKAAHYFGLTVVHTPVGPDYKADVKAMEKAVTANTVMFYVSAPQFCHGIIDSVEQVSDMAIRRGIPLHVDACFGGFMLPWVEKLGYPVPKWDFRCPGVTSISADCHKYGYTVKGASVIVYKNNELRKYQIFTYAEWPGGLYGSPSMAGTRPGGNIAAAWASLKSLGEEGFIAKAKELMDITDTFKDGIREIDGLTIIGDPVMTAFAIGSNDEDVDILAVADVMESKGWAMERAQKPDALHCSILPHHKVVKDTLIADLKDSVKTVKDNKSLAKKGTAGMYGMMASIPDKAIINDFISEFFSEIYKVK